MRVLTIVTLLIAGAAEIKEVIGQNETLAPYVCSTEVPLDCEDHRTPGVFLPSGVYRIRPLNYKPISCDGFLAYCEMEEGSWTVILRRYDGSEDFNLLFNNLKYRVGYPYNEHFTGLIPLHYITSTAKYWMKAELWAQGQRRISIHEGFLVGGEDTNFTLTSGIFRRNMSNVISDGLVSSNRRQFSARDANNDASSFTDCARDLGAPGWHAACGVSSIFGPYGNDTSTRYVGQRSMHWSGFSFGGPRTLNAITLKLRRTPP